jgi:hypothetical protein
MDLKLVASLVRTVLLRLGMIQSTCWSRYICWLKSTMIRCVFLDFIWIPLPACVYHPCESSKNLITVQTVGSIASRFSKAEGAGMAERQILYRYQLAMTTNSNVTVHLGSSVIRVFPVGQSPWGVTFLQQIGFKQVYITHNDCSGKIIICRT